VRAEIVMLPRLCESLHPHRRGLTWPSIFRESRMEARVKPAHDEH